MCIRDSLIHVEEITPSQQSEFLEMSPSSKRRRLRRKTSQSLDVTHHSYTATYSRSHDYPTRTYVRTFGAQSLPRILQFQGYSHTIDFDIQCSIWNVIDAVFDRLNLQRHGDLFQTQIDTVKLIKADRDKVCTENLHMSTSEGKDLLNKTVQGKQPAECYTSDVKTFLHKVESCGRLWRWVAMSLYTDTFNELRVDETTEWPEQSVASHEYFGIEAVSYTHLPLPTNREV